MKSPIQFLIALAVLLATATVFAQVYRWVDKDGKVHYTDTPPPKEITAPLKKINVRTALATSDGVERAKATVNNLKEIEKKKETQAEAAKKVDAESAQADAHAQRCRDAKRARAALETGRPLASTDDNGERRFMTDEERASRIQRAQEAITESCK